MSGGGQIPMHYITICWTTYEHHAARTLFKTSPNFCAHMRNGSEYTYKGGFAKVSRATTISLFTTHLHNDQTGGRDTHFATWRSLETFSTALYEVSSKGNLQKGWCKWFSSKWWDFNMLATNLCYYYTNWKINWVCVLAKTLIPVQLRTIWTSYSWICFLQTHTHMKKSYTLHRITIKLVQQSFGADASKSCFTEIVAAHQEVYAIYFGTCIYDALLD